MYHVILAGGSGTRFWPKSRIDNPKQLLKMLGDETKIRQTYNRLSKIANTDKILVVASQNLSQLIHKDIPEIPRGNFIIEPSGKNTAPSIGLVASHLIARDPGAVMGVFPADHLIVGHRLFSGALSSVKFYTN